MDKRIIALLCILSMFGLLGLNSLAAASDSTRLCSLTLDYTMDGRAFAGLTVELYRVAAFEPDGSCRAVAPFDRYPIRVNGITSQTEWQHTAQTLLACIAADRIDATRTGITEADGSVVFSDLPTGLYLVKGVTAQWGGETCVFRDFMICLPTPTDGEPDYDCTARPKCSSHTAPERYRVVKLWKDSGTDTERPHSVTVELLQDGILRETVRLHDGNNWSYSWEDPDGAGRWSVIERDVPDGYRMTIAENGGTFVVTNTADPDDPDEPDLPVGPGPIEPVDPEKPVPPAPSDNPKTGDTTPLWLYILVLCLSGFGLLIIGIGSLRRDRHA